MNKEPGRKQHLNLSCTAYEVIQSDYRAYEVSSLSSVLNTIFLNCYEGADATIDLALLRRQQELMKILSPIPDEGIRAQACRLLIERDSQQLRQKAQSYPKAYGFKFYLNAECAAVLEEKAALVAQHYKSRPALYLKAVIEEYASHSPPERERLFFKDTFETLETCIAGGHLVTIETGGKRYDAKPWQIVPDDSGLYHYLIALSCPSGEEPSAAVPASFRISRMAWVRKRPKSFRSGRLSLSEQEQLRTALSERGAAFLLGQPEEIVVRFTEEGELLYRTKRFLRPNPTKTEQKADGIYCTFRCTPYQIQSYLLPFGPEAEVLSPGHLRERFRTLLSNAAHLYND